MAPLVAAPLVVAPLVLAPLVVALLWCVGFAPAIQAESPLANFGAEIPQLRMPAEESEPDAAADAERVELAQATYPGPQGIRPEPRIGGRPLRLYRNAMVESLIRFFSEEKRDVLERGWRRSGRYLTMIRRVLRAEGVPEQLAYLAAVESNFNPLARSPARAVGLWQFTAPTARKFGLRMHPPWYDERLDPESSTHAAARLLAYLYDRYESWELALAAYNAGEARVNDALERARRQGAPEDYWNLRLPRQTQGFVPAFLALAAIMEAPQDHGLDGLERDAEVPSVALEIDLGASLADLASRVDVAPSELVRRNPAWRGGLIPPFGLGHVLLRLPPGTGARLLTSLRERPPEAIAWLVHRVNEGETVSHIAQAYGVQTSEVLAMNRLRSYSRIDIGQSLLVPIAADTPPVVAVEPSDAADASTIPAMTQLHLHRVQSGDSLWSIARRYGVRMTELRIWNQLAGKALQPNQILVVFLPTDWAAAR